MRSLLVRLVDRVQRAAASRELARQLGGDDLLFFALDPDLGVLLPALGFPQTLPEGRAWREFLATCRQRGEATAELPSPHARGRHRVHGVADGDDGVMVLLGGKTDGLGPDPELRAILPVLTAVFHGERVAHSARGEMANALYAATRAEALADALDGARRGLATANVALQEEVGERRRAEEALGEADRRKDEFLATLAHELRNPLAPIRNGIEVFRMRGPRDAAERGVVDMMERQVGQMVRLVDDLMDVARITRGKLELRRERVELRTVIERAIETSRPLIDAPAHELCVELPARPMLFEVDPIRLAQAISNLLNNAARYTDPGGRIDLVAEREQGGVVISVRDTGRGIPGPMLARIFDVFAQVDSSLNGSHGGLGIGLTLVQKLVEMHGGTVTALSEGPSRGSTFIIRLPRLDDAGRNEPAVAVGGPGGNPESAR